MGRQPDFADGHAQERRKRRRVAKAEDPGKENCGCVNGVEVSKGDGALQARPTDSALGNAVDEIHRWAQGMGVQLCAMQHAVVVGASPMTARSSKRRSARLVRDYNALLDAAAAAAKEDKSGPDSGRLVEAVLACLAHLQASKSAWPARPMQVELLWLNTARCLERMAAPGHAWRTACELMEHLRAETASLDSHAHCLLAQASMRAASAASSSVGPANASCEELAKLSLVLSGQVLPWVADQPSDGCGLCPAIKAETVWEALTRCALAMLPPCSQPLALDCWRRVIRSMADTFVGQPERLAKAAVITSEAITSHRALENDSRVTLLEELRQDQLLIADGNVKSSAGHGARVTRRGVAVLAIGELAREAIHLLEESRPAEELCLLLFQLRKRSTSAAGEAPATVDVLMEVLLKVTDRKSVV